MHTRSAVSRFPVVVGIVGGLFLALTSVASGGTGLELGDAAISGAAFHVPTPGVGTLMVIGLSGTFGRRRRRPA